MLLEFSIPLKWFSDHFTALGLVTILQLWIKNKDSFTDAVSIQGHTNVYMKTS